MQFNERIKEQRQKLRYTQKELAEKVNVSPQVISNWERGYTSPSPDDIKKLSTVLQTSTDYLLGKSNNPEITINKNKAENKKDAESIATSNMSRDELIDDILKKAIELDEDDLKMFIQFLERLVEKSSSEK